MYIDDRVTVQRSLALWILKIREVHKVPLSVMDDIILDTQSLIQSLLRHLSNHICSSLKDFINTDEAKKQIHEVISNYTLFHGLETQSRQLSYFKQHFNFVVSSLLVDPDTLL